MCLPIVSTTTIIIYKALSVNNFNYKHKYLIPIFDNKNKTRFKHNINMSLPNDAKVFGQKSIFYIGLKL